MSSPTAMQARRLRTADMLVDEGETYVPVWRVLDPLTGRGPYHNSGWLEMQHESTRAVQEEHGWTSDYHVGWRTDGLAVDEAFGFATLDKARRWFGEDLVPILESVGCVLVLALASLGDVRVGKSGRQLTFESTRSIALETLPIRALHSDESREAWTQWKAALVEAGVDWTTTRKRRRSGG